MTKALSQTLQERGAKYGKFRENSEAAQQLKRVIAIYVRRQAVGFLGCDQQEALDMICHKIGRIVCGDPDWADSWHDIAGYAQLVADRLSEEARW